MMGQFLIAHPVDPQLVAAYGWDFAPAVGFFVEVRYGGRLVGTYDGMSDGYNAARPLEGALLYLVDSGFLSEESVGEALLRGVYELPEDMPERTRRAAEVVANFRRAAD